LKSSEGTAPVTKTIMTLSEKTKTPVEVNDYPGFVANRILMPMINEAIETLYNKVAVYMRLIPL
jgi:3-hydroxybutyryl-CoA dehydrogenase